MTFLYVITSFSLGWALGSWWRGVAFDNMHWRCLRWNPDSFGYRPVAPGQKVTRSDKVVMALDMDPAIFPEEGIIYTED